MLTAWMNSFGNKKDVEADGSSGMEQKKSATKTNPESDPEMGLLDDTFQTNKDEEKRLEGDGLKKDTHGKKKIIALVFVLFATVLVGSLFYVASREENTSSGFFCSWIRDKAPHYHHVAQNAGGHCRHAHYHLTHNSAPASGSWQISPSWRQFFQ
jgi:hypothetical protein